MKEEIAFMIKDVLKGMIIGLANIIPGVSGGTMAVSMGIYDKLIHCVTHFTSEMKKNIAFLLPVVLGMGIAIIGSAFGIAYLFETFPVQTNFLFIGLILGSLPSIYNKVKKESIQIGYLLSAIIFFVIVVEMALLNGTASRTIMIDTSFYQIILLFFVGVIAAGTMVIPGISGSMMLLLLGYYNPILDTIKEFFMAIVAFDLQTLIGTLFVLVPFGVGVLVGIIVIAKIIEVVFQKIPFYAYWSIIGLLVASPIAIILVADFPKLTVVRVLTGMVTFIFGWIISGKLGEKEE